jgi:hypothetical protein
MTIEYDLTPADYAAFAAYHHSFPGAAGGSQRRLRYGFAAAYLAIFAVHLATGVRPRDYVWLALAVLWFVFVPRLYQRFVRRNVQRIAEQGLCRGSVGPHRMIVAAEGITDVTPHYEWMTRWSGVERVIRLPERLLIYVGTNAAFQVPRRAFATDVIFEEFVAEVEAGIGPVAV